MSDINVTPLVDVMLVLLVIFMITAPLLTAGVQVDLPKTSAAAVQGQDEPIAVTVDRRGRIFIQESEVTLDSAGTAAERDHRRTTATSGCSCAATRASPMVR